MKSELWLILLTLLTEEMQIPKKEIAYDANLHLSNVYRYANGDPPGFRAIPLLWSYLCSKAFIRDLGAAVETPELYEGWSPPGEREVSERWQVLLWVGTTHYVIAYYLDHDEIVHYERARWQRGQKLGELLAEQREESRRFCSRFLEQRRSDFLSADLEAQAN